jgi:hypothetical protein
MYSGSLSKKGMAWAQLPAAAADYGADKVARASVFGLTRLRTLNPLHRIAEINGEPGLVSYVNGRPQLPPPPFQASAATKSHGEVTAGTRNRA